jgi:hypothetical protein
VAVKGKEWAASVLQVVGRLRSLCSNDLARLLWLPIAFVGSVVVRFVRPSNPFSGVPRDP